MPMTSRASMSAIEIHPGEDVFDGATFEMFLDAS